MIQELPQKSIRSSPILGGCTAHFLEDDADETQLCQIEKLKCLSYSEILNQLVNAKRLLGHYTQVYEEQLAEAKQKALFAGILGEETK